MNADDYKKVKEIFNSAVEIPPEGRGAFLNERCNGDGDLRKEVERLLDSMDDEFLERPASQPFSDTAGLNNTSRSGQRINHYEVIRRIGSGGMGDVYLATDGKLGRQVAIKILPDEFTSDESRLDRFQLEARSASSLSHPNILTIFEIGEWQGTHYIATEYVEGETMRQRLSRERLSIGESMDLGIQLASGIAAAHEASICHRDIKPENIMIRRDGLLKVVDFGLAKLVTSPFRSGSSPTLNDEPTVKIVNTEPGVIMGTVQYMSPEQTRGLATDERSDIWSLGCVLYEMLTGHAPFKGDTSADMVAEIVKTHPELPSRLATDIPERLDEIISKSLEKHPDERYQTAKDLLIDLKRLKRNLELEDTLERSNPSMRNEPVTAVTSGPNIISTKKGPKDLTEVNSAQYLYWGIKAHRWTAVGITLLIIGLVGGTALLVRYYWRERDPNEARQEYFNKIKLAVQAIETSNLTLARNLLDEVTSTEGQTDFRSFEWGYLDRLYRDRSASQPLVLSKEGWVSAVAFSPDGKHLATAGTDKIVTIWDVQTGLEIRTLNRHSQWISSVEFSSDGRKLLSSGWDKTAKVWDVESGLEILTLTIDGSISPPTFLKNGTAIAATGNGAIRVWDSTTGKETPFLNEPVKDNMAFRFSPDEKLLAIRDVLQNIRIVDASSGATVANIKGHTDLIISIKFSPDSRYLLTTSVDATAKLWDIRSGKEIRPFKGHTETIQAAVFSPDGKMIATGSNDDSIKIWSVEDGFLIDTLRGHTGDIMSLAFSSDGRLASGGGDNRIRIWPVPHTPPQGVLRGHSKPINQVTFSKDSKMLASTSEDGTARIWDADTERQRLLLEHQDSNVLSAAFSHDGRTLATGGPKALKLWSTISGRTPRTTISTNNKIGMLAFSADDKLIATEGEKNIPIWDVSTGQQLCSLDHEAWTAEFMSDANRIFTSGSGSVKTWDLKTCTQVSEFKGEEGFEYYAVYSKTGKPWAFQLLNESRSLKLIDTVSGKEIASFFGHEAELWGVDFSPDGKRLATADISGLIKIWDVSTGHDLLTLKANVGQLSSIAISPDGKTLAAAGHDGIVRLFRSTF